jgi:hypothetical protein
MRRLLAGLVLAGGLALTSFGTGHAEATVFVPTSSYNCVAALVVSPSLVQFQCFYHG